LNGRLWCSLVESLTSENILIVWCSTTCKPRLDPLFPIKNVLVRESGSGKLVCWFIFSDKATAMYYLNIDIIMIKFMFILSLSRSLSLSLSLSLCLMYTSCCLPLYHRDAANFGNLVAASSQHHHGAGRWRRHVWLPDSERYDASTQSCQARKCGRHVG